VKKRREEREEKGKERARDACMRQRELEADHEWIPGRGVRISWEATALLTMGSSAQQTYLITRPEKQNKQTRDE